MKQIDPAEPIHIGIIENAISRIPLLYRKSIIENGGLRKYLEKNDVILTRNHFVYAKGGHGSSYVNIKGLKDISALTPVAMQMAYNIHISGFKPDVIVGVPHGADVLASQIAFFYTLFSGVSIFNLKIMKGEIEGEFVWYKDHGDIAEGKAIMLIEDVINTGGSLVDCGNFVQSQRCAKLGCIVVCDRISDKNPGLEVLGARFNASHAEALLSIDAENYIVSEGDDPREACPLCKAGIKINQKIGHGKRFLEKIENTFPELHRRLS